MNADGLHIADALGEYLVNPPQSRLLDVIATYDSSDRANVGLRQITGIRSFFPDSEVFDEFRRVVMDTTLISRDHKDRQWGDFQTPPRLAAQVCEYLVESGIPPQVVVEPTCGTGNFILATLCSFPNVELVYGVEIQEKYHWHLKIALLTEALRGHRSPAEIELHQDNIFTHRFPGAVLKAQNLLIIGNPPGSPMPSSVR